MGIIFIYGLSVGVYKIFPYESLNWLNDDLGSNYQVIQNPSLDKFDLYSIIDIKNESDIIKKRVDLIKYVWNSSFGFDLSSDERLKGIPTIIEENILDERFTNLDNLKQIDKFSIEMKHGINSIVYLFLAKETNDQLIIYHQGHDGGFINGESTINYFLDKGYSVMAFSMPLVGMNNQPIINVEHLGPVKFIEHNQFELLESENFSPISYFLTPINHSLNYLDENYYFVDYHMIGISGGGWTSTIYPAIDTRISKSFSVSGSLPLFLRINSQDIGDYEQIHSDLYKTANYLELYLMSSYGQDREFVQVFNKYDPCCFSGTLFHVYENDIKDILYKLDSGSFDIILDNTHKEHKISEFTLPLILEKIQ